MQCNPNADHYTELPIIRYRSQKMKPIFPRLRRIQQAHAYNATLLKPRKLISICTC